MYVLQTSCKRYLSQHRYYSSIAVSLLAAVVETQVHNNQTSRVNEHTVRIVYARIENLRYNCFVLINRTVKTSILKYYIFN